MEAWSFKLSLLVLALATVVTAFVAEALDPHARGVRRLGRALRVLRRRRDRGDRRQRGRARGRRGGRLPREAEARRRDRARLERQVAVFLIPAVALLSWLIEPLALSFREVEIVVLAGALVFTSLLLWGGRSTRLRGIALIGAYVVAATAFFIAGVGRPSGFG